MTNKLSKQEFVERAIKNLRKSPYKGIHTVYSKFNSAFREYYDGADPVEATKELQKQGVIAIIPKKGGAMIYLADDIADAETKSAEATVNKIVG